MDKSRNVYICSNCGHESLKWLGRCPGCQEWNTLEETTIAAPLGRKNAPARVISPAAELSSLNASDTTRRSLSISEFNRVLGGGIVPGSLMLLGGEPGIGKSTLLLQVAASVAQSGGKVVYVSGEENPAQIKMRAQRLGISGEGLFLMAETDLNAILAQLSVLCPSLVVIDSIQTVFLPELEAAPGAINQVRESALRLMQWAKSSGASVFITAHVTKEGNIAGPRILEHIVDVVMYFEGESQSAYRLIRSVKNRFGSTNEVGIFEMKSEGLVEVANPSQIFLSNRQANTVGSAVTAVLEGSRPLLVEVQALTNTTSFGQPRRTANGVDFNRTIMIAAVLSKRLSMRLGTQDIIVNATGGIRLDEPAADLAIALAIASSYRDIGVCPETIALGEIGLSGELRTIPHLERRLSEASRLGFTRALVPAGANCQNININGIQIIAVSTVKEAIKLALTGVKTETEDVFE
ncbi:DNA repair protein RadA [Dehalococcoides mccartyi]|jgi:DNA replication and repair protein RadA|uniref:DNA repair protein RadA n=1 Tax=Dehalococcoides mccartyi (strain CBDB1) TaxID=255470 RepID=A0A916NU34_DEHMC|nr:DNA repair protein RadA [Dehalococcoides mccartyi]AQX74026.1 DNA repair protein RadA [Dehalococcoides mccartyi]AQY72539.1 DNA repair protein RadA [Dehalococcoides mccartyi]CAI82333.1 DNA repair protein RadA [Dehalococcoides mccartyi CBDB1]